MNDLDFLKEHWNSQDNFPLKSKEELHSIIKKSSSNILKWIIGANMLELSILLLISLLFHNPDDANDFNKYELLAVEIFDLIIVSLPIVFSIYFFILIRRIKVTDSISKLMSNIFHTRKMLNIYIYINMLVFLCIVYIGINKGIESITHDPEVYQQLSPTVYSLILILSCIMVLSVFMLIVWGFYKILYGRLLNKLKDNYNKLIDLE